MGANSNSPVREDPARAANGGAAQWVRATAALIVGVTLLRLLYVWFLCPYQLVEDEAAYWVWSRHLDWSYHTKGPGIALAIRGATWLLGDSEAAIRTVAVLSSAVAAWSIGALGAIAGRDRGLGARVTRRGCWQAGFIAAALFLLAPGFQVVGLLTTIDGPYVACWAVAALAAYRAMEQRLDRAWLFFGVAVGVGFLFKYTILLLLPGVAWFALARRYRFGAAGARLWGLAGLLAMLAGFAPVVVWNQQRGWPTVAHLLGHLGMAGGDMPVAPDGGGGWKYDPRWTLEFLGTQLGFVGPALVLAIVAAVSAVRARQSRVQEWPVKLFMISCAAPILAFYLLVSLKTEPEGNWAMGGYVTLLPLAAWAVVEALPRHRERVSAWRAMPEPRPRAGLFRRRPEVMGRVLWHWSVAYGVIAALGMARVDLIAAGIPKLRGRVAALLQARELSLDAADRAAGLARETGREPFYLVQHYGRASIMTYYIPGHPAVLCSSSRMGGRKTPFDYWPETSLDDPTLLGRPAVLVGATIEQWAPIFDRVAPIGRLKGEHKRERDAFLGYGFRGWGTE